MVVDEGMRMRSQFFVYSLICQGLPWLWWSMNVPLADGYIHTLGSTLSISHMNTSQPYENVSLVISRVIGGLRLHSALGLVR